MAAFAVALLLASAAPRDLPWDGPIVPVDDGRAILAVSCPENSQIAWSDELRRAAHGMAPGEPVWIITPDGTFKGTLGRQECYGGECHAAYAALPLIGKVRGRASAIVPRRFLTAAHHAMPLRKQKEKPGTCDGAPRLKWRAGSCTTWSTERPGVDLQIQTEVLPQDTGWDTIRQHVRVRRGTDLGAWNMVFETVDELEPVLMIADGVENERSYRILWFRAVGIGGPAQLTTVFSRLESDATLTWGHPYTAGGQPCD